MTWSIIIVIKFIIIMIPSSSHGLSYSTFSNPWRHRGSGSHPALFDQGASRSLATTAKTATGRWSLRIGPDFSSKIWRFTDQSWWFDYAIYIYINVWGFAYQYSWNMLVVGLILWEISELKHHGFHHQDFGGNCSNNQWASHRYQNVAEITSLHRWLGHQS